MSSLPPSADFADLATRWLDGIATPDEAARLWAAIKANPENARAFAELARFELLLESTSQSVAREAIVCAVADEKTARYQHRRKMVRTAKLAAGFVLFGSIIWMLWPQGNPPSDIAATTSQSKPVSSTQGKVQSKRDRVLIAPPATIAATATTAAKPRPLPQHLDEFFLTSVQLDKVLLQDAVRQMEAQLRALNFGRTSQLDQLRVVLPASAMNREVSFKSGAISFMKALRAVAALAGCEVLATDTSVVLNTRKDGLHQIEQRKTTRSLLAADGLGRHTQLAELLEDARALGIVSDDDDEDTLRGTNAQFEALALMADSRHQVRALPDLSFFAYLSPAKPNDTSRVLTAEEASEKAKAAPASAAVIRVDPGSTIPTSAQAANADLLITAVPAGDGTQLTISPNFNAPTHSTVPSELSKQLPIDIILPPGYGGNLHFPLIASSFSTDSSVTGGTLRSTPSSASSQVVNGASVSDWTGALTIGGTGATTANFAMSDSLSTTGQTLLKGGQGLIGVTTVANGSNTYTGNIVIQSGTLTINGVVYAAGSVISGSSIPAGANLVFTPATQTSTTNPD
jgi:hypothetical protein